MTYVPLALPPGAEIARAKERLATLEEEIHKAYARWMELDGLTTGGQG